MTFSRSKKSSITLMILMMSTIIGVSSTNWITIWVSLEINVLAMCKILASNSKMMKKSETTTFMYYLIQVMLSLVVVASALHDGGIWGMALMMAIMGKVGMWPIHSWYMKLISSMEMKQSSMMIIMTWQKILPIVLVMNLEIDQILKTLIMVMMAGNIVASLARLEKNFEMKKIMAISSMNNNSWILGASMVSLSCMFVFLSFYSTTLVLTLSFMEKMSMKMKSMTKNFWLNTMVVGNLSGLPPLGLFWAKISVISLIMKSELPSMMALLLMVSACILMYHYLWMSMNETANMPEKSQMVMKTKKENLEIWLIMSLSVMSAAMFMSLGLTKSAYLDSVKLK